MSASRNGRMRTCAAASGRPTTSTPQRSRDSFPGRDGRARLRTTGVDRMRMGNWFGWQARLTKPKTWGEPGGNPEDDRTMRLLRHEVGRATPSSQVRWRNPLLLQRAMPDPLPGVGLEGQDQGPNPIG